MGYKNIVDAMHESRKKVEHKVGEALVRQRDVVLEEHLKAYNVSVDGFKEDNVPGLLEQMTKRADVLDGKFADVTPEEIKDPEVYMLMHETAPEGVKSEFEKLHERFMSESCRLYAHAHQPELKELIGKTLELLLSQDLNEYRKQNPNVQKKIDETRQAKDVLFALERGYVDRAQRLLGHNGDFLASFDNAYSSLKELVDELAGLNLVSGYINKHGEDLKRAKGRADFTVKKLTALLQGEHNLVYEKAIGKFKGYKESIEQIEKGLIDFEKTPDPICVLKESCQNIDGLYKELGPQIVEAENGTNIRKKNGD